MLNAPADEYFTFQVISLSTRPHLPVRGAGVDSTERLHPESALCSEVHTGLLSPSPQLGQWPPNSRFFRERRAGHGGAMREGDRVFVTLAFRESMTLLHSLPLLVL